MRSIRFKSMVSLSVVSLLIMFVTFICSYFLAESYLNASLHRQIEEADHALSIVLKEPVFAYDKESSEDILKSFAEFPYIHTISVSDHRGKLIAEAVGDGSVPKKEALLTNTIDVLWENNKLIGSVSVTYQLDSNVPILTSIKKMFFGIGFGLLLAQLAICWVVISKYVIRPLQSVIRALSEVAEGEGDLTQRLDINSSDEVGLLARQFDLFIDKLQGMVGQIVASSNELSACSDEIKNYSVNNSTATGTQLTELEQVATALSEMSSSTKEVHHNAEQTALKTTNCNKLAAESRKTVEQTVRTINTLAGDLSVTESKVTLLKERSVHISTVLDVIRGIADQTNLLALNAAIEAARAGQQGRGFAVVADEVRHLAQRTQNSTLEIEQIIQDLQHSSIESSELMSVANQTLHEAVTSTEKAMGSLQHIIDEVDEINDMNVHVADATKEQNIVAAEISEKVTNITMLTSEVTQNVAHVTELGTTLDDTSSSILMHLGKFKV